MNNVQRETITAIWALKIQSSFSKFGAFEGRGRVLAFRICASSVNSVTDHLSSAHLKISLPHTVSHVVRLQTSRLIPTSSHYLGVAVVNGCRRCHHRYHRYHHRLGDNEVKAAIDWNVTITTATTS